MSKRYVLNPETGRLVDAEGCAGLKIINQLLKQKKQVQYRSTKSTMTCGNNQKRVFRKTDGIKKTKCVPQTQVRKKCPKGEIEHEGKCIKKQLKPVSTRKPGRPKTAKPVEKCLKGEIKREGKCIKKPFLQKYDKIVKEIKSVYNSIKKRVDIIDDVYEGTLPHGYPDELYIQFEYLKKKMPEFVKFSGFSDKIIKQIIKSCEDSSEMDDNPVVYLKYVLNSILAGEPSSDMRIFHDYFGFPK